MTARPTAVNIADSANKLKDYCIKLETKLKDAIEYKERYFRTNQFKIILLNIDIFYD